MTYTGNWTAGQAATTWLALTDNAANGTDFAWSSQFNSTAVAPTTATAGVAATISHPIYFAFQAVTTAGTALIAQERLPAYGYGGGYMTGQPKPQYVPMATPWLYGGAWFTSAAAGTITTVYTPTKGTATYYVEELAICFGTYLPASTA